MWDCKPEEFTEVVRLILPSERALPSQLLDILDLLMKFGLPGHRPV